jgi:hypothetical protein
LVVAASCPGLLATGASLASPQDLHEEDPRIQHRDHQAQDDPGTSQ